jgi:putative ABC transport system substrate-binding protein
MRRRDFIAGLGSAAAWPLVARAQQQAVPVIGYFNPQSADDFNIIPFLQGLKDAGYVEGQNVAIEYRYAEGQFDRLPALAADFVRRRVAVIVAAGGRAARAAKAATTIIPIVFATGADPVASGLVATLNRPGGNLTGITILSAELAPKRLQLLHELIPNAVSFAVLADPASPNTQPIVTDLQTAASTLGLQLIVVNARTDGDLETAFATFSRQRLGAVLVGESTLFSRRMEQLAALTARHALPAIYAYREFTLAGGLMSYGSSFRYFYHQVGIYTGRILKGEKPADLPVEQAVKIELVINLKTAKALGLTIPHQPQDRQGPRPHHPGNAVGHCRRGDPVRGISQRGKFEHCFTCEMTSDRSKRKKTKPCWPEDSHFSERLIRSLMSLTTPFHAHGKVVYLCP